MQQSYLVVIQEFQELQDHLNQQFHLDYPDVPISRFVIRQTLIELRRDLESYLIPEEYDEEHAVQDDRITTMCEILAEWLYAQAFQRTLVSVVPLDEFGTVLFALR